jgi:hypothetical protein
VALGLESRAWPAAPQHWHRLLEICALSDTLIVDEDGMYNPAQFNDGSCSAGREGRAKHYADIWTNGLTPISG